MDRRRLRASDTKGRNNVTVHIPGRGGDNDGGEAAATVVAGVSGSRGMVTMRTSSWNLPCILKASQF
ncbi:unnamed protein product [Linum trigynum]|uniref:Uncharacterized protein n=1 Tax=Linum trigynum TaxID=586398 RepID=A0AAV2FCQ9_9ROSI